MGQSLDLGKALFFSAGAPLHLRDILLRSWYIPFEEGDRFALPPSYTPQQERRAAPAVRLRHPLQRKHIGSRDAVVGCSSNIFICR
jgi:hypothetical protein